MRVMGLDLGEKTLGVALSDEGCTLAAGLLTLRRDSENKLRETFRGLEEIVKERGVGLIVLGLPLNMDGSRGPRVDKTLAFKEKLEKRLGLPVVMQDERLTSAEAEDILREQGKKRDEIKMLVDTLAAELILQDYINGKA